jgi:hypothetical protein
VTEENKEKMCQENHIWMCTKTNSEGNVRVRPDVGKNKRFSKIPKKDAKYYNVHLIPTIENIKGFSVTVSGWVIIRIFQRQHVYNGDAVA